MSEQASVNIPKDLLEPIIRQHIQAGVVAAVGDPAKLIETVIERMLKQKVNREGKVESNECYNRYDLIELVAQDAIHKAAKAAVEAYVNDQRPAIEAAVRKAIERKTGAFAKALVDGLVSACKQSWKLNCEFTLPRDNY
jgi:hypothetical protein